MRTENLDPLGFRKSRYSSATGQNCVEVADTAGASTIRDSQNRESGHLMFPSVEWAAFLRTAKV